MSAAAAAWAGVFSGLLVTLLGVTWRAGSKLSSLETTIKAQAKDLDDLEDHVEKHDAWHMGRLGNGKDTK